MKCTILAGLLYFLNLSILKAQHSHSALIFATDIAPWAFSTAELSTEYMPVSRLGIGFMGGIQGNVKRIYSSVKNLESIETSGSYFGPSLSFRIPLQKKHPFADQLILRTGFLFSQFKEQLYMRIPTYYDSITYVQNLNRRARGLFFALGYATLFTDKFGLEAGGRVNVLDGNSQWTLSNENLYELIPGFYNVKETRISVFLSLRLMLFIDFSTQDLQAFKNKNRQQNGRKPANIGKKKLPAHDDEEDEE